MLPKHKHIETVSGLRDLLGAFRMPISKQQLQDPKKSNPDSVSRAFIAVSEDDVLETAISCHAERYPGDGNYRVKPIFNTANGGVLFPVYDEQSKSVQTMDRRSLSDHLLTEIEALA
ncbi:hypothetical protein Q4543_23590 [Salipiger sp. 1_MG-2023]|nr:hypothetical protein [Salipiger sp. 1_MG-2023]